MMNLNKPLYMKDDNNDLINISADFWPLNSSLSLKWKLNSLIASLKRDCFANSMAFITEIRTFFL